MLRGEKSNYEEYLEEKAPLIVNNVNSTEELIPEIRSLNFLDCFMEEIHCLYFPRSIVTNAEENSSELNALRKRFLSYVEIVAALEKVEVLLHSLTEVDWLVWLFVLLRLYSIRLNHFTNKDGHAFFSNSHQVCIRNIFIFKLAFAAVVLIN